MSGFSLTPLLATAIFIIACLAGYTFRRTWVAEGPLWKLWLSGAMAALGLLILGFVPLAVPG